MNGIIEKIFTNTYHREMWIFAFPKGIAKGNKVLARIETQFANLTFNTYHVGN